MFRVCVNKEGIIYLLPLVHSIAWCTRIECSSCHWCTASNALTVEPIDPNEKTGPAQS